MKILITGTAGFIGYHVAKRLLKEGHTILGIDNLNTYYDISLKQGRLASAGIYPDRIQYGLLLTSSVYEKYSFIQLNLEDKPAIDMCFKNFKPDVVINLAAQAGVRYSLMSPETYVNSNIVGFLTILEGCRYHNVKHLLYASSSSVYGLNGHQVFSTSQNVDHPISLYAATKKSNELMAHTYSHLFNLPVTGLRFFTVYGPWGRPDMALFIFTKAILEGRPIEVFNEGEMYRDFTYIDDVVEAIFRITISAPPSSTKSWDSLNGDPSTSSAAYEVYNIGNSRPVKLTDFIDSIEEALDLPSIRQLHPLQPGDVISTYADVSKLQEHFGYTPMVSVRRGVEEFISWYKSYYKIK